MIKTIAIVIIMGLSILPLSGHVAGSFKDAPTANIGENRNLASWPQWSKSEKTPTAYFRNIDGYLNDNFAGRTYAIIAQSIIKRVFNDPSAKAVRGRTDDWLFNGNFQRWRAYMGQDRFTEEDVDHWFLGAGQLRQTVKSSGAEFAVIIPPTKSRIYPEKVARRYGAPSARRFASELYKDERSADLGLINVDQLLIDAKAHAPVYFKTDSHWTSHGAYQAYAAVMSAFNEAGGDYPVLTAEDLVSAQHEISSGDLARYIGLEGVLTESLIDLQAPKLGIPVIRSKLVELGVSQDIYRTRIAEKDGKKGATLLVIGDSFSTALEPFFLRSFSKVIFFHHREGEFDLSAAMSYAPDAVLFAPSEHHARRMRGFGE